MYNKRKILNDPIYGFISLPDEIVLDLIEHPFFQRLRRIKQLGLTHLVYPGALHTRFHHALGAMHLMGEAIKILRSKGNQISKEEERGVIIAILLHDIGHGPFSHALERCLVEGVDHEDLSVMFMNLMNKEFNGQLTTGIQIFRNEYPKKFLHQLVSSQLDMDRLDYLKRDSFYSGVSEGVVGSDRIIKMLDIKNDELVVEEKGIYSIEKFLVARRLMYWQVYLHKTVLGAEHLLEKILERALHMAKNKKELFCSPAFRTFLYGSSKRADFDQNPELLKTFSQLDDYDILSAIKVWCDHEDPVLSTLCRRLVNRELFRIELQKKPFESEYLDSKKQQVKEQYGLAEAEVPYFFHNDTTSNKAYDQKSEQINILLKSGQTLDIAEASDNLNISALSEPVEKYFICYPKDCC